MAVADYLTRLRPMLKAAADDRRDFLLEIGRLMETARAGNPDSIVQSAYKIGREQAAVFRRTRSQLDGLRPPPACDACHTAVASWLDMQVASCDVLVEVGSSRDLGRLKEAQSLLAEGRTHARRFNSQYAQLVAELRRRVQASAATQRIAAARRNPR